MNNLGEKIENPDKNKTHGLFHGVFFFYILFNEVGPNQAHTAIKT